MSIIHVLDEATINQIAAGEVVERPSAVIKELIENAMDAGATAITAEIKEGGLSLIRITDNGGGIAKEDIPLAFVRHATSKIKTAEDLLSVTSLGFRGEALSSIASVAQVELITKTPSALNGYRYLIEGGDEKALEEIGCPSGTTILVRNLFFNTPARRNFLKSSSTEAGYISDLMERLMVSHPNVSFKFIMNNQVKLQSSGNNNSKDILYHVYGRDISKELLSIDYQSEDIKISGYIGKPVITRGNRNFENYFINGRYIKSTIITKAIEEAYKPFLMQHKYPFTSIYFEINPALIDVNVHPQKMELRLKNSEEVYRTTQEVLRTALIGKEMIPKVALVKQEEVKTIIPTLPEPFEENRRNSNKVFDILPKEKVEGNSPQKDQLTDKNIIKNNNSQRLIDKNIAENSNSQRLTDRNITENYTSQRLTDKVAEAPSSYKAEIDNSQRNYHQPVTHAQNSGEASLKALEILSKNTEPTPVVTEQMNLFTTQTPEAEAPFLSKRAMDEHRIIGQLFSTYWLIEYKNELYIIDQHAAHEKVLYERIMSAAKTKTFASQQLLPPIILSLTLREQETLTKQEEVLKSLGYEFEHFGGNEYSVRAVPADLYSISERELLLEFLDELTEDNTIGSLSANSILERTASLSCKAAVKANHVLSNEEAKELIKELLTLENPYHCPHGRPVIVAMSQYELERKFKRVL
jgi:DNA mismatch repair protein MutL